MRQAFLVVALVAVGCASEGAREPVDRAPVGAAHAPEPRQTRKPDTVPATPIARATAQGPSGLWDWPKADASLGYPRVLVSCGAAGLDGRPAPHSPGAVDAVALKAGIEELLLQDSAARVIDARALQEEDRRQAILLGEQDDPKMAQWLAGKLNADLVISLRMTEGRQEGARYRVTVEATKMPAAQKIGGFSFDWKLGNDAATIKRYAARIMEKLVDQFARLQDSGSRYLVRLVGLPGGTPGAFLDALQQNGLRDIRVNEAAAGIAEIDANYRGGPWQLSMAVQAALLEMNLIAERTEVNAGSVVMTVVRAERWRAWSDGANPKLLAALRAGYARAGAPRIAVLIAHPPDAIDMERPGARQKVKELDRRREQRREFDRLTARLAEQVGEVDRALAALRAAVDATQAQPRPGVDPIAPPVTNPAQAPSRWVKPSLECVFERLKEFDRVASEDGAAAPGTPAGHLAGAKGLDRVVAEIRAAGASGNLSRDLEGMDSGATLPQSVLDFAGQVEGWRAELRRQVPEISRSGGHPDVLAMATEGGSVEWARVVTLRPIAGNSTAQSAPPAPYVLDAGLTKRMLGLGLNVVDPGTARAVLSAQATKAEQIYGEEELAALLRSRGGFDILVLGAVDAGNPFRVSIRAIRLEDGAVVAAEACTAADGAAAADSVETVCDRAAGCLADQLCSLWSAPQTLTVRVEKASTLREVLTLASMLRQAVPEAVSVDLDGVSTGMASGVASLRLNYQGLGYAELIDKVAASLRTMPFDLDPRSAGPHAITVVLRERH